MSQDNAYIYTVGSLKHRVDRSRLAKMGYAAVSLDGRVSESRPLGSVHHSSFFLLQAHVLLLAMESTVKHRFFEPFYIDTGIRVPVKQITISLANTAQGASRQFHQPRLQNLNLINIQWMAGHGGQAGNEAADKLTTEAVERSKSHQTDAVTTLQGNAVKR